MAVVVRCTGCRGASQVGADAIGLLVVCPQCREHFVAIEEAAAAAPAVQSRPVRTEPLREPRQPRRDRPRIAEAVLPTESHDIFDPPIVSSSRLPASVLIGFALLPFAIPLLWLIGPFVLAQPPALTLAAPASLAIAASSLCLAVVFTVDWSPATRIKGVLMLVGLSYFAGFSLYFMKENLLDRAKNFFGPAHEWHDFQPRGADYSVLLPVHLPPDAGMVDNQPLSGWNLETYRAFHSPMTGPHLTYQFGSGPDAKPQAADWFGGIEKDLRHALGKGAEISPAVGVQTDHELAGQEWNITLADGKDRIVRVFRANGKIYYLAVEGESLDPNSPAASRFLRSLQVKKPAGK